MQCTVPGPAGARAVAAARLRPWLRGASPAVARTRPRSRQTQSGRLALLIAVGPARFINSSRAGSLYY
jgi:hypothetical protein